MQKYFIEAKLNNTKFDKKDFYSIIILVILCSLVYVFYNKINSNANVKITEQYYLERFVKVPSKEERFKNDKYDVYVSKLLLEDPHRNLKYKFEDLNNSINSFKMDLLKQQAMSDIIYMLNELKKGNLDEFDMDKMQQAILEAGYGKVDKKLLRKSLEDYKNNVAQNDILRQKLLEEKAKTEEKMKKDAVETTDFALDIAREVAEDEIEGFIENLSLIARVGYFIIQKTKE